MSQRWWIATVNTGWFRHSRWKLSCVVMQRMSLQQTFSAGVFIGLQFLHLHHSGTSSPGACSGFGDESCETNDCNKLRPPRAPAKRQTAVWSCSGERDLTKICMTDKKTLIANWCFQFIVTSSFRASSSQAALLLLWTVEGGTEICIIIYTCKVIYRLQHDTRSLPYAYKVFVVRLHKNTHQYTVGLPSCKHTFLYADS